MIVGYGRYGDDSASSVSGPTGESVVGTLLSTATALLGGRQAPVPMKPADEGIFGLPKMIALVGGAVLLVGVGSYVISKRKVRR